MAFQTTSLPAIDDPTPSQWSPPNLAGGIVYTDLANKIADNQSSNMLNEWYKEKILTKRYGQEWVNASLGSFPILNAYGKKFNGKMIFSASTKLYSLDLTTKIATEIYSGLTAVKGSFFVFRNKLGVNILYYKNGHEYIQYDGTTVTSVVGYIPTVIMGRAPTGGGSVLEQYNRLQPGFINSFSPNGSATVYQLTLSNLDATTVTCTLSGSVKTEGVDFTVNRVLGQLTFTVAPIVGTDTLKVTAYKTDTASKAAFMATIYTETFGGDNDTRIFFGGGSNTFYYSGLLDPSYIPENQYNNAGDGLDDVYGFGKQYNVLVVFKSNSMYVATYSVNSDGSNVRFSMAQLNNNSGCDMPWTIQVINDSLVWCHSTNGVQILNSTNIKDEKNVSPISFNINGTINHPGLLNNTKADLQKATSFDYFGMYWLCVGSKVWVWDYSISSYVNAGNDYDNAARLSWFPMDNINASCFFGVDGDLYIGDRTVCRIAHFINKYADFGLAINGYWETKKNDMGLFNWTKYIMGLRYSTKTDVPSNVTVEYFFDDGSRVDSKIDKIFSFNWDTVTWDTWKWSVINFAITISKYIKKGNTVYFSAKFSNNEIGQNLSLLDLAVDYILQRRVK